MVKGFDVSALLGNKELQVWMKFNDEVDVLVRHVSREALSDILKLATTSSWDRKHQKEETVDNLKYGELVGEATIVDWRGLVIADQIFPCIPENIHTLMRKWVDFAKFISDLGSDLERLVAAEKEAVRKNSLITSGQQPTTPP